MVGLLVTISVIVILVWVMVWRARVRPVYDPSKLRDVSWRASQFVDVRSKQNDRASELSQEFIQIRQSNHLAVSLTTKMGRAYRAQDGTLRENGRADLEE